MLAGVAGGTMVGSFCPVVFLFNVKGVCGVPFGTFSAWFFFFVFLGVLAPERICCTVQ